MEEVADVQILTGQVQTRQGLAFFVKNTAKLNLPKTVKLTDRFNPLWGIPFEEIHRVLYGKWDDHYIGTSVLHMVPNREHENHVKQICAKQSFTATYHDFKISHGDQKFQCLLVLNGVPCLHTCGTGSTPEQARYHAAYEAVRCFLTLTRPVS